MTFEELRDKHPEFIYQKFELEQKAESLTVTFHFLLSPDIHFQPKITFSKLDPARLAAIAPDTLNNLIFNLGLVELISYWKASCSPKIIIQAGQLSPDQITWWQDLLVKGLGEFFYINKIDFTSSDLVSWQIDPASPSFSPENSQLQDRDLVLIGGGKDSAVSLDILSASQRELACLLLNPTQAALDIVAKSGQQQTITIQRTIDPKLLELNEQGYLNGHTPFSAYLAFLSTLAGVLYDYKNQIVSNESSANEGNITWLGQNINHQYSKSFEFEQAFRSYCQKYLTSSTNYFSLMRPLSELQIAKIFSQMPKYHQVFRSCNRGSKTNSWCGDCPKCLFAYIILYPFLGQQTSQIFGQDLLSKASLLQTAKDLIRLDEAAKPFECVGLADESRLAFYLSITKYRAEGQPLPLILDQIKDLLNLSDDEAGKLQQELLTGWKSENNLSGEFSQLLKDHL